MRFVGYIVVALCSSGFTALMFYGGVFVGPSQVVNPPRFEFSYSDFVSFLLTVLAIILTALALVIGLVAFRTISEIKREAGRIAEEHSKAEVERRLAKVPEQVKEEVISNMPEAMRAELADAIKRGEFEATVFKGLLQISLGGGLMNRELQPGFEEQEGEEDRNA